METKIGEIVKAVAGRDSGRYFVILDECEQYVYIADGKTRKRQKTKRKSLKHLEFTGKKLKLDNLTNKKLKIVLGDLSHTP